MAVFYAVSVIGLALSLHFCGGKLANVQLFSKDNACRLCKDIPAVKKDDGCCKNSQVSIKVKDSHQTEASVQLPKLYSTQVFLYSPLLSLLNDNTSSFFSKIANKAPPISRLPIYIFNCIFRN